MSTPCLKRLPPDIRVAVLSLLDDHAADRPVSIAGIVHALGEHHHGIQLSEPALKSCIADAALQRGFVVAFDGT